MIKGDLGIAQGELTPTLTLDPALRIATVVAYTAEMDGRLRQQRFLRDPVAAQMREQIKAFDSGVPPGPSHGDDACRTCRARWPTAGRAGQSPARDRACCTGTFCLETRHR